MQEYRFYTLLVSANPAVVRAALMGSLALAGRLIGKPGWLLHGWEPGFFPAPLNKPSLR
jgi:hypothetical protein